MTGPGISGAPRTGYPSDADKFIREVSNLLFLTQPINMLNLIRDQLFGDADRAVRLANQWGRSRVMSESRSEIQAAKDTLAGYWSGSAYNQFNSYASSVVGILDSNQSVMGSFATTLGTCTQIVHSTYANAIKLIGQCAADLANLGLLTGTLFIPGVDLITAPALVLKAIDKLTDFVKNVLGLIADATTQIGAYKSAGISFSTSANNFKTPEPLSTTSSSAIADADDWHVLPTR